MLAEAVSDGTEGPFTNPVQLACGGIDPAIFIDDDGQAYYYWGQLFSHGVRLNEDMLSFNTEQVSHDLVTEELHFFHEGSSMRKIGDTYYYVYSNMERGKPTSLGYSTGKNPLGPFTYQGTIDEVKMTSQGVGEPFAPGERIMGYQACEVKGQVYIGLEDSINSDYEEVLMNISEGDEAVFRYVRSDVNYSGMQIQAVGSGEIAVLLDGNTAGIITIEEDIQTSSQIHMESGLYELRLQFRHVNNLKIKEFSLFTGHCSIATSS